MLNQHVQYSVLEEGARAHPNIWWWIKADGADLLSGLGESVKGEWSGDVDLNDGSTQQLYKSYRKQLDFLDGISVKLDDCNLKRDIEMLRQQTVQDIDFVSASEFTTLTIYTHVRLIACKCIQLW